MWGYFYRDEQDKRDRQDIFSENDEGGSKAGGWETGAANAQAYPVSGVEWGYFYRDKQDKRDAQDIFSENDEGGGKVGTREGAIGIDIMPRQSYVRTRQNQAARFRE